MGTLAIKNAAGLNVARFYGTMSGNYLRGCFANTWPDSTEHDVSKECVKVRRVIIQGSPELWANFYSTTSHDGIILAGWRSGNFGSEDDDVIMEPLVSKYLMRIIAIAHIGASAASSSGGYPLPEAVFDYPEGVICNPSSVTFGMQVSSDSATPKLTTGKTMGCEIYYEWMKAGTAELGAYLLWENLGA